MLNNLRTSIQDVTAYPIEIKFNRSLYYQIGIWPHTALVPVRMPNEATQSSHPS
jgi:hypothetical protein